MPELPEVETVRRQLEKAVVGRTIESVDVSNEKSVGFDHEFQNALSGLSFTRIDRVGKLLIFSTSNPDTYLLGHLKMTGQFAAVPAGSEREPDKHTHVVFHFTDGSRLFFRDVRKFGYVLRATEDEVAVARERYGIEPLTPAYTLEALMDVFKGRRAPVKAVLLNQALVAGLGNIYVDEACFRAGVRPGRRADKLTRQEKEKLFYATESVIREAIKGGGTTFESFANVEGEPGRYSSKLRVFGREGKPCLVCGTAVRKTRVAGRGTHFCPTCQK